MLAPKKHRYKTAQSPHRTQQWDVPGIVDPATAKAAKRGLLGGAQPDKARANWADKAGVFGAMLLDLDGGFGKGNARAAQSDLRDMLAQRDAEAMAGFEKQRQASLMEQMKLNPQQQALMGLAPQAATEALVKSQFAEPESPEYFAPVETESGYAQFSDQGGDPRIFSDTKPYREPQGPMSPTGKLAGDLNAGLITQDQYEAAIASKNTPAAQVTVNTGDIGAGQRPIVDKPEKGWQHVWDEESGTYRAIPIPGGPKADEARDGSLRDYLKINNQEYMFENVSAEISDIKANANGWTTGWGGAALKDIPATDARALQNAIKTVNANLSFERLQQMREESKTGGALGQVTELELEMLQSTIAKLDQLERGDQLVAALDKIQGHITKINKINRTIYTIKNSGSEDGLNDPRVISQFAPELMDGFGLQSEEDQLGVLKYNPETGDFD